MDNFIFVVVTFYDFNQRRSEFSIYFHFGVELNYLLSHYIINGMRAKLPQIFVHTHILFHLDEQLWMVVSRVHAVNTDRSSDIEHGKQHRFARIICMGLLYSLALVGTGGNERTTTKKKIIPQNRRRDRANKKKTHTNDG